MAEKTIIQAKIINGTQKSILIRLTGKDSKHEAWFPKSTITKINEENIEIENWILKKNFPSL